MPAPVWQPVPLHAPDMVGGGPSTNPDAEPPLITPEKFEVAAARLPRGKAAGPDGIPNEVLAIVAKKNPGDMMSIYQRCLRDGVFPCRWKKARLVLFHKGPDKPLDNPSSFKPLYILDIAGKLLERILLQRIIDHQDTHDRLSSN